MKDRVSQREKEREGEEGMLLFAVAVSRKPFSNRNLVIKFARWKNNLWNFFAGVCIGKRAEQEIKKGREKKLFAGYLDSRQFCERESEKERQKETETEIQNDRERDNVFSWCQLRASTGTIQSTANYVYRELSRPGGQGEGAGQPDLWS